MVWRWQVGARGSAATKDMAGKMMGGKAGEETDQVADADNSHAALEDDMTRLAKGRGAEAVRMRNWLMFPVRAGQSCGVWERQDGG